MTNTPMTVEEQMAAILRADREAQLPTAEEMLQMTEAERAELNAYYADEFRDEAKDTPTPEPESAAEVSDPVEQPAPAPEARTEAATPVDYSPQIDAIAAQRAEAREKIKAAQDDWDNGEISEEDYQNAISAAQDDVATFTTQLGTMKALQDAYDAQSQAAVAEEAARADQEWNRVSAAFAQANPEFTNDVHFDGFNATVQAVTSDVRFAALPFDRQLDIAAKQYVVASQALGGNAPAYSGATPAKQEDPSLPPRPDPSKRPAPPVTLADVPSSGDNMDDSTVAGWARAIDNAAHPDEVDKILSQIPSHILDDVLQHNAG